MDNIKRFIECLVPVTTCNMKCSYCYIMQEDRRTNKMPEFQYSPEQIGKALSKERLGGTCYISICGSGETLLPLEVVDIARNILDQGHYVNITTNGTINKRFDEIIKLPAEQLERLHFAFSFHYLELVRLNKVEDFFENIKKVRNAGCSFVVQVNLYDEYIPYLEEINTLCREHVGALPQLAATRDEETEDISLLTNLSMDEYKTLGRRNNSPLFDFTMKNFMIRRKEFCYAGDWSFKLYLDSGIMRKCYASKSTQNIFEDLNRPIKFQAVGNKCQSPYCVNSSHFMSLGVIPGISTPSYADLRDRPGAGWYTSKMKTFLDGKFKKSNKEYNVFQKLNVNIEEAATRLIYNSIRFMKKAGKRTIYLLKGKRK